MTFSFCFFTLSNLYAAQGRGVSIQYSLQQSHPVITKACLRAPVEIEMSQAHHFSKAMKSWSGHSPKHDFSDSKWHCPWPLALPRWGALVEGGLHQGKQEELPGTRLRVELKIHGAFPDWGCSLVLAKTRAPWRRGNRQNDSSWLRAQKMYANACMQTKIRL